VGEERLVRDPSEDTSMPPDVNTGLNVEKYRREFSPPRLFSLLEKAIILQMIKGFFSEIRKGVALLYAEEDATGGRWVISEKQVRAFDYEREEDREFFNPVCWRYRKEVEEESCRECERRIAQEYVDGARSEVKLYPCWLGLDDLAFPLRIGGEVRGVLFAGQIVPNDDARVAQIEASIKHNCRDRCKDEALPAELINDLRNERKKQWGDKDDYANNRLASLKQFGGMIQRILDQMYEARTHLAMRLLLQETEVILASGDMSTARAWWENCETLLSAFRELAATREIHVYTRRASRFERELPFPVVGDQPRLAWARYVVPAVRPDRLVTLSPTSDLNQRVLTQLGLADEPVHVFRSQHRNDPGLLASLIVVAGTVRDNDTELVESFCRRVTMRTDIASMVFRLRDAQQDYRTRVGEVAHSFRTPLYSQLLDLEAMSRVPAISGDPAMAARVEDSVDRLYEAREDIRVLIEGAADVRETCDLVALVKEVLGVFAPAAEAHPCKIVEEGAWPGEANVHVNSYRVRRALCSLVDNAIKYSYGGYARDWSRRLHEVRVSVYLSGEDLVAVRICNYGIGIPPEWLGKVVDVGERVSVPDPRRERPGTGWGLPMASQTFSEHDGWLSISSYRSKSWRNEPGKKYHRYITEVIGVFPLVS